MTIRTPSMATVVMTIRTRPMATIMARRTTPMPDTSIPTASMTMPAMATITTLTIITVMTMVMAMPMDRSPKNCA